MENLSVFDVHSIMEEKEELVTPFNGVYIPTLRKAHFLKPNFTFTNGSSLPSLSRNIKLKETQLKVEFRGRRNPFRGWRNWVLELQPKYQHIWKKSGIFEAIMASTYQTLRDNDLVLKLAEIWSVETNTFVFPLMEATITLEDIMVLGGYSVLGDSVLVSVETMEMIEKHDSLKRALKVVARKSTTKYASDIEWADHFIGSKDLLEHEAFLCLWLSRFVLPMKYGIVTPHVFPIALYLSAGIRIALAPAVLASIYRDLSLMKNSMVNDDDPEPEVLKVWAPFQLVQLWAWERLPSLAPIPKSLKCGEPRSARWDRVQKLKVKDVRKVLSSSVESFIWRPYTTVLKNWDSSIFYWENEEYVMVNVNRNLDMKTDAYVRFLRVSELVGMDCVELYLPHRVAMQFGFDQDVPANLRSGSNESPRMAWSNYIRPITDSRLYIPPRLLESDVTTRYVEWWNQRIVWPENEPISVATIQPFPKHRIADEEIVEAAQVDDDNDEEDDDDKLTIAQILKRRKVRSIGKNEVDSSFSPVLSRCDKGSEMSLTEPELSTKNQTPIAAQYEGEIVDVEKEVKIGIGEENVSELDDFEARVETLEKIFALIKAGKIVCG